MSKLQNPKKKWLLYDARNCGGNNSGAPMLAECSSEKQAKGHKGDFGSMACYSYDVDSRGCLVNEQWEWDYYET